MKEILNFLGKYSKNFKVSTIPIKGKNKDIQKEKESMWCSNIWNKMRTGKDFEQKTCHIVFRTFLELYCNGAWRQIVCFYIRVLKEYYVLGSYFKKKRLFENCVLTCQ